MGVITKHKRNSLADCKQKVADRFHGWTDDRLLFHLESHGCEIDWNNFIVAIPERKRFNVEITVITDILKRHGWHTQIGVIN